MTVRTLLAQYGLVQARIETLMQEADVAVADLSLLMRQAEDIRDRIVTTDPATPEEAALKIACLANLLRREAERHGVETDMGTLLRAIQTTCATLPSPAPGQATKQPAGLTPDSSRASVFGGSVAEYVTFAVGKVSLIDTNYYYVATSAEHAASFGRSQVEVMGAHVADLVGQDRFRRRARARLDACFAGKVQSYHYGRVEGAEGRITRCQMSPVSGSDGAVIGALVFHTDVTEQIRRLRGTGPIIAPAGLRRTS